MKTSKSENLLATPLKTRVQNHSFRLKHLLGSTKGLILIWLALLATFSAFGQQNFTIKYGYDNLGQLDYLEYPDGSRVNYEYNNEIGVASRVTYETGGTSYLFVDSIELNQSGLLETVNTDGGQKLFDFDSLGRLKSHRFLFGGVTRYAATDMTYNHMGDLKTVTRADPSINAGIQYGYTEQGQLRSFQLGFRKASYRYDKQGNMTAVAGFNNNDLVVPSYEAGENAFDEANRHDGWDYDDAGRLRRDDSKKYYYNTIGQLALVRELATGILLQSYLYDAAGKPGSHQQYQGRFGNLYGEGSFGCHFSRKGGLRRQAGPNHQLHQA